MLKESSKLIWFLSYFSEKPQVVNEYESSKAVPNQAILGKLERTLGIKLRGKDKGAPLAPKGKKGQ